jgi:hypothetical protein
MLYYYLKQKPAATDTISLDILEQNGTQIKNFTNQSAKASQKLKVREGNNLFVWDMRYPDAVSFDGLILYSSNTKGPKAVPGRYKARLTVNGKSVEQDFEILKDPRVNTPIADMQAQFDFLIEVRDKLSEAHQAVIDIRSIRKDLKYLKEKMKSDEKAADIIKAAEALDKEMTVIENNIHETRNEAYQDPLNFGIKLNNRLAYLATHESAGDFRPTDQAVEYKKEVSAQIDQEIAALQKLLDQKLPEINRLLEQQDTDFLSQPKKSPKAVGL